MSMPGAVGPVRTGSSPVMPPLQVQTQPYTAADAGNWVARNPHAAISSAFGDWTQLFTHQPPQSLVPSPPSSRSEHQTCPSQSSAGPATPTKSDPAMALDMSELSFTFTSDSPSTPVPSVASTGWRDDDSQSSTTSRRNGQVEPWPNSSSAMPAGPVSRNSSQDCWSLEQMANTTRHARRSSSMDSYSGMWSPEVPILHRTTSHRSTSTDTGWAASGSEPTTPTGAAVRCATPELPETPTGARGTGDVLGDRPNEDGVGGADASQQQQQQQQHNKELHMLAELQKQVQMLQVSRGGVSSGKGTPTIGTPNQGQMMQQELMVLRSTTNRMASEIMAAHNQLASALNELNSARQQLQELAMARDAALREAAAMKVSRDLVAKQLQFNMAKVTALSQTSGKQSAGIAKLQTELDGTLAELGATRNQLHAMQDERESLMQLARRGLGEEGSLQRGSSYDDEVLRMVAELEELRRKPRNTSLTENEKLRTICVKGLHMDVTVPDLITYFATFGRIIRVNLMCNTSKMGDKYGKCRGFGWVTYGKPSEAVRAIETFRNCGDHPLQHDKNRLVVEMVL